MWGSHGARPTQQSELLVPAFPCLPPHLRTIPVSGPSHGALCGESGVDELLGFPPTSPLASTVTKAVEAACSLQLPVHLDTCSSALDSVGRAGVLSALQDSHKRDGTFLPLGVTVAGGEAWTSSLCPVSCILRREGS